MISGISDYSSYYWLNTEQTQRKNPFEENDANGDGSLDLTELGSFTEKMSEMTGQTVDAQELMNKLDSDGNGSVSEEEFEAGRPEGPPPGGASNDLMAVQSAKATGGIDIQTLIKMLSGSQDDESSTSDDPLDTNGDGIVDAQEARAGLNAMVQEYMKQAGIMTDLSEGSGSQLNLQV